MSITIGDQVFDGPFQSAEELDDDAGVFAVIIANGDRGTLIDVGETESVGTGILNHPDKSRWQAFTSEGTLCYAVLYTPTFSPEERKSIEQNIRNEYSHGK